MNDNPTIYRCIPGQLPEDIIPNKFTTLNDGRLISPLVRIGSTTDDLFRELPPQSIWMVLGRRLQTKNKKRFTWSGKHPLYWKEI